MTDSVKVLEVTEENVQKAFGMSMEDLLRVLMERLGYEEVDSAPG